MDKSKFHKKVIGPYTGEEFIIRRVRMKEFMTTLGTLPLATSSTVQDVLTQLQERAKQADSDTENRIVQFYATKGVVSPKIWFGKEEECPESQIYFEDLGSDLDYVVTEVINYSHEMVGLKQFAEFFRGAGTGDTGSDSEAVRPETIEPPPEGNLPQ